MPSSLPGRRRLRRTAAAGAVVAALLTGLVPAASASASPTTASPHPNGQALGGHSAAVAASAGTTAVPHPDRARLDRMLRAVHEAGIFGVYSSVRDGRARFDGAAGLADVDTGRPVRPDLRHRVGSITKSFTAVAVLQQTAKGRIGLDRPVGDYVPDLVPGERGRTVTVRMLLNHTSGIADYIAEAFPSLKEGSTADLDDQRYRSISPRTLVRYGVGLPQWSEPGAEFRYSNTNYILLGEILRKVTGEDPERVITRDVIRRAGLKDTYFPGTDPRIRGPHARMYENFYGLIDPPRDYSVYNMTWGGTAGALVSTMGDLNSFYRTLLRGDLLPRTQLRQMLTTVPMIEDEEGNVLAGYGLGIYTLETPCGPVWGHDGGVWGAGTWALSDARGGRQFAAGWNLMKYQRLNESGTAFLDHPADAALAEYRDRALCGDRSTTPRPTTTGGAQTTDGARAGLPTEGLPTEGLPTEGLPTASLPLLTDTLGTVPAARR